VVRSNNWGDMMVVVTAHPEGSCGTEMSTIEETLINFWKESGCNLKSLYFQLWLVKEIYIINKSLKKWLNQLFC
jgi:hypothetical protein